MKNLFKIATVSALAMLSANAMAEDANQDFTWTGTVPAAGATGGIKVIRTGATEFDAGEFTLTKTADNSTFTGYFDIAASIISFDVVTDDASEDHVDYYYTWTSYTVDAAEFSESNINASRTALGLLNFTADGAPLTRNVTTQTPATTSTDLTFSGNTKYTYGETYALHTTLLITDQVI